MGTIYFEGSMDFIKKTSEVFKTIEANPVGLAVITGIKASDKDLVFVPRHPGMANVDGRCNARASADSVKDAYPNGTSRQTNTAFRGNSDNRLTPDDERYSQMPLGFMGTGAGSDAKIKFSVDDYLAGNCHGRKGAAVQPDDVLLHEMVHALRKMQGKANPIPTDSTRYENDEEFLAIVVTNVYVSAKGGTQFRADHMGHSPLKAPLDTSSGFLTNSDNKKLMSIYRLLWTPTFIAISKVSSAKFNPFRQLALDLARFGPVEP